MKWQTFFAIAGTPGLANGTEPPSRDWQPRYQEFARIAEQPPYSNEVKARIVELLALESELLLAVDEAGEAGSLGEGFLDYYYELVRLSWRFAKKGVRAAALALIRSTHCSGTETFEFVTRNYLRETLACELSISPRATIHYAESIAKLGKILGSRGAEIEAEIRLRIEERITEGLKSADYQTRLSAIWAARAAKLKATLPRLREIEGRVRANFRGSPPEKEELRMVLRFIEELEKLP